MIILPSALAITRTTRGIVLPLGDLTFPLKVNRYLEETLDFGWAPDCSRTFGVQPLTSGKRRNICVEIDLTSLVSMEVTHSSLFEIVLLIDDGCLGATNQSEKRVRRRRKAGMSRSFGPVLTISKGAGSDSSGSVGISAISRMDF